MTCFCIDSEYILQWDAICVNTLSQSSLVFLKRPDVQAWFERDFLIYHYLKIQLSNAFGGALKAIFLLSGATCDCCVSRSETLDYRIKIVQVLGYFNQLMQLRSHHYMTGRSETGDPGVEQHKASDKSIRFPLHIHHIFIFPLLPMPMPYRKQ